MNWVLNKVKLYFRGQRSVESLSSFIVEQLKDPVNRVNNMEEIETLEVCVHQSDDQRKWHLPSELK